MIGDGFADRVAVLAVDAEEAEVGLHGVAAAECLVNHHRRVGGEEGLVAGGDLRGGDVAGEDAVAVDHDSEWFTTKYTKDTKSDF